MFSARVEQALRRAGWAPNRQIDITPYIDAYKQKNYGNIIPEVLKSFLTEFGGLYVFEPGDRSDCYTVNEILPDAKFYESKRGLHKRKPWFVRSTPILYKDLRFKNKQLFFDVKTVMHFDVIEALDYYSDTIEDYCDPRVQEKTIPFGEIYCERLRLEMTPSGKIYGREVDFLTLLGNNYVEFFENVYNDIDVCEKFIPIK